MKRFFKSILFLLLFFAVAIVWFLNFHKVNGVAEASNHCRVTQFYVENGGGEIVFGSEDMEIDAENGLAFISAYNRSLVAAEVEAGGEISEGGMYVWDLNAYPPNAEYIEVRDISSTVREQVEFRPHGTSMLRGDGWWRFFVVNHAFPLVDGKPEHLGQVLVLDYLNGELAVEEVISASIMCSPNDVASLGPKQFLVTNDHGACDEAGKFREEMMGQKTSYLLYWDGSTMRQVAGGFAYANGISISPTNPNEVYLAATREEKIHVFDGEKLLSGGVHQPSDSFTVPFSPDNLTWDIDGRLIVAGFPNLYRFAAHRTGLFGDVATPAIAMAIAEPKTNPQRKVLFNNETGLMRGATVASVYGNYTIATSVFDENILICEN